MKRPAALLACVASFGWLLSCASAGCSGSEEQVGEAGSPGAGATAGAAGADAADEQDAGTGGSAAKAGSAGSGAWSGSSGTGGPGDAGGSGGTAGTAGGGGSAGAAPACAPPSDGSKAALCIVLAPEPMTLVPSDLALDGKGVLFLEVFDTPNPDLPDGGTQQALAGTVLPPPADAGLGEVPLATLASTPIRFDGLPGKTVYARGFFADNAAAIKTGGELVPGTWIGGYDLSNGVKDALPIQPITLAAGSAKTSTLPLVALRRLLVSVSRASTVTPAGDGQGPLQVLAIDTQKPGPSSKLFGLGRLGCADLSGTASVIVKGAVAGTGPFWLMAFLDDLAAGGSGGIPDGAMASLEIAGGQPQIPASNKLAYAADAYQVSAAVQMSFVIPKGDASGDHATCKQPGDAGKD
jgi:hypothetical protein